MDRVETDGPAGTKDQISGRKGGGRGGVSQARHGGFLGHLSGIAHLYEFIKSGGL